MLGRTEISDASKWMYRGRKTKQKKTGHGGGLSDGGASGLVMKKKRMQMGFGSD